MLIDSHVNLHAPQFDEDREAVISRALAAGVRLMVRPEIAPEPADEADRRMLAAMAQPRRLEQIGSLARTPRYRLLAFLHFLRAVDALDAEGVVAEKVRNSPAGTGLNAATGEYEDLLKAGVADPVKVTRSALQNAASIAGLFLTTEAVVADKPEKAAAPAGDPTGGMGGMDF